ncbi:MAG: hypothetical protein HQL52_05125 [Magnetococcales bacterium]|nr:hypothetical protein [Magnetococcales bacterium]
MSNPQETDITPAKPADATPTPDPDPTPAPTDPSLDQIRDILVGPQKETTNRQYNNLTKQIEQSAVKIQKRTRNQINTLQQEIKSNNDTLQKALKSNQNALQQEIGAVVDTLHQDMTAKLDALEQDMKSNFKALSKSIREAIDTQANRSDEQHQTAMALLKELTTAQTRQQAEREAMAEMMVRGADILKGGEK